MAKIVLFWSLLMKVLWTLWAFELSIRTSRSLKGPLSKKWGVSISFEHIILFKRASAWSRLIQMNVGDRISPEIAPMEQKDQFWITLSALGSGEVFLLQNRPWLGVRCFQSTSSFHYSRLYATKQARCSILLVRSWDVNPRGIYQWD